MKAHGAVSPTRQSNENDNPSPSAEEAEEFLGSSFVPAAPSPGSTLFAPALPSELANELSAKEKRTAYALLAGLSWSDACKAAGLPRSKIYHKATRERIERAARWLIHQVAQAAGTSREWIITQWVSLYRRATQSEPVRDKHGNPIGVWKYDGPTAAKCLEMLGRDIGMYGTRSDGMTASDVATLLRAVADRGRPPLPSRVLEAAPAEVIGEDQKVPEQVSAEINTEKDHASKV